MSNRATSLTMAALVVGLTACGAGRRSGGEVVLAPGAGVVGAGSRGAIAEAERSARAYSPADVEFMQQMIPHHAQAIIMGRWAQTRATRNDIRLLAERIAIAQADEIRTMRKWLAERNQAVPDSMSTKHVMTMPGGMTHEMLMPGMLTDEQMAALERARGTSFDRLFLTSMIAHHRGAIGMVEKLLSSSNTGHDETVYRFASDVVAEQTDEVRKMLQILETIPQ